MGNIKAILENGYKKLVMNTVLKTHLHLGSKIEIFKIDNNLKKTVKVLSNTKNLESFLRGVNYLIEKSKGKVVYNKLKVKIDLEDLLEKNRDMLYEIRAKKEDTVFDYIVYSVYRRMQMLNNFKAYNALKKNIYLTEDGYFIAPGNHEKYGESYVKRQWYWDSCFHSIILARKNPKLAKSNLALLIKNQSQNGFIPHMNYFDNKGQEVPEIYKRYLTTYWSHKMHSDITQPPLLAMAVNRVYKGTNDEKFLSQIIPKVISHYNWFHNFRLSENGLVSIIHPWESGWDNSQRWDELLDIKKGSREEINKSKMFLFSEYQKMNWNNEKILKSNLFVVQPVDFNCIYSYNLRVLAKLCEIKKDIKNMEIFLNRASAVDRAIETIMKKDDYFVDYLKSKEKRSNVKSAAMFFVLLTNIDFNVNSLIKNHLLNEREFATRYPVPSVSIDTPLFNANEYWRGNTWININWFIIYGLIRRGYKTEARRLINKTLTLVRKSGFRECYNPFNSKGMGAENFGWSTLGLDLYETYKNILNLIE